MDIIYNPIFIVLLFAAGLAAGAWWKVHQTRTANEQPDREKFQANVGVVAVVGAVVVAFFFQLPSLSIDVNAIFSYAFDVVNAFMPLIAIIGGLGLGFSLIGKISALFSRAI